MTPLLSRTLTLHDAIREERHVLAASRPPDWTWNNPSFFPATVLRNGDTLTITWEQPINIMDDNFLDPDLMSIAHRLGHLSDCDLTLTRTRTSVLGEEWEPEPDRCARCGGWVDPLADAGFCSPCRVELRILETTHP